MTKLNGNGTIGMIIKIMILIITVSSLAAGIIISNTQTNGHVEVNTNDIKALKPEVALNSKHRYEDERDKQYLNKRLDNIEASQQDILKEIRWLAQRNGIERRSQ